MPAAAAAAVSADSGKVIFTRLKESRFRSTHTQTQTDKQTQSEKMKTAARAAAAAVQLIRSCKSRESSLHQKCVPKWLQEKIQLLLLLPFLESEWKNL